MEKEIIAPIDVELLKAELTEDKKLRNTNKSNNELYIVTWQNAPNVVKEIGRLREIAFRAYGGGSGLEMDLDEFDTMENPYKQLIVWDPDSEKILGGYRYILGPEIKINENGQPILATSHMFHFSEKFIKEYLPNTIELGRSFVTLEYQSTREHGTKALFALDNLWDGLGALTVIHPEMKYFFGKFTMYPDYDRFGRDLILTFLWKHFGDKEELVVPFENMKINIENDPKELNAILTEKEFKEDYVCLNTEIRKRGTNIPPLVNAYMNLSSTMKFFGTAVNDEFGDVEESGILINFEEVRPEKRQRHIESFRPLDYLMFKIIDFKRRREVRVAKRRQKVANRLQKKAKNKR
jgi:hypothetical protein